jgi:5'-3' exonuclease
MGIPFYFASLCRSYEGIVTSIDDVVDADVFAIDFNCLIHKYLRDDDPYVSVITALQHILKNVCRATQVIIAFDGIVPYAKMVQQRYRRMRTTEPAEFDRNQISPDTPYMRNLESELRIVFPDIIISGTTRQGEGEHKLFNIIRTLEHKRKICIYGLDADLILLALQNHGLSDMDSMFLIRESPEFGDLTRKNKAKSEFGLLSIWKLYNKIPIDLDQYIALSVMCFGNDFMPCLGLFSLREHGHEYALKIYEQSKNPNLLTTNGRKKFLLEASKRESEILQQRIKRRDVVQERMLVGSEFCKKYYLHVMDGNTNIDEIVEAYWKTYHWTMYYFTKNEPVNWDWHYPYPAAPLISDIIKYKESPIQRSRLNYSLANQLQFILPVRSLRTARKRVIFPDEKYEETREPWMKKFDWEMTPRISLPWHPSRELTTVVLKK